MLSRTVQLFSRKQTLSVVTCLPCDTESFQTCVSNGCGGGSPQNTSAQTLCSPKLHPYISSVKIPFAFPRAGTLFTRSPGCSLDPISFGLSHKLAYHMQTRSLWSTRSSVGESWLLHHRLSGILQKEQGLSDKKRGIFTWRVHREFKYSQNEKFPVGVNSLSSHLCVCRRFCDKTSSSDGNKSDSSKDNLKTEGEIEPDEANMVKEWLQELRDDFKTTSKESDVFKSTAYIELEKSLGTDESQVDSSNSSSSSSSSDSENESDDFSEEELENTAIQEVLDHAEYYAEDGHNVGKGKKTKQSQKPTGTDLDEQSKLYSQVSECAENVNAKQSEDDFMIDIEEFPDYESDWEEEKPSYVPPIPLTRGKEGVFDLGDLVTLLTEEKAKDICVIRVAEELHYVDYLVLLSAMSFRHITALTETIHWIYKRRKGSSDPVIHIEGGRNWTAMDLGNIALHIMMPNVREEYDIETLWTCGAKYDEKSRDMEEDPYLFSIPLDPDQSASGQGGETSKE